MRIARYEGRKRDPGFIRIARDKIYEKASKIRNGNQELPNLSEPKRDYGLGFRFLRFGRSGKIGEQKRGLGFLHDQFYRSNPDYLPIVEYFDLPLTSDF